MMFRVLILACLVSLLFSPLLGLHSDRAIAADEQGLADSPWPMFGHDPQHTGRSPYNGPGVPIEKWSFSYWGASMLKPVIAADGTVYVGAGAGKLFALNPDGTEKWTFTTGDIINSSPAIAPDGTIYVGSWDNNLYALNPDGTEKWSFSTGYKIIDSSPAIAPDGTIYIGSCDNKFYAINADGSEKWSITTELPVQSSPVIAPDGTVYYTPDDHTLCAINPEGTEKWSFSTPGSANNFSVSPAISSDGTVYVDLADTLGIRKLYAINPDGTEKWSLDDASGRLAIADDGTIYTLYFGKLLALNPDGTEKWRFDSGSSSNVGSYPVIAADGIIYIGIGVENFYAINPDGTEKWSFFLGDFTSSYPIIAADGTIYVISDFERLHAIGELTLNGILDQIQSEVSNLRYLSPLEEIVVDDISSEEMRQLLEDDIDEEDIEDIYITQDILVLMDLMEEDEDLYQIFLDLHSEGTAGFYDDETGAIYIIGDTGQISPAEEKTLAHEYTHALQDQHFDLSSLGLGDKDNSDLSMAIRSLVEGDASLLAEIYYWQVFDDAQRQAYDEETGEPDPELEALLESIPDAILQQFIFPYTAGENFVYTLGGEGGWDAVNAAYNDLPQSTEQILHPERYTSGDEPQVVTLPDLESTLGGTWSELYSDVLGELDTILYLNAFLDMDQAKEAAEGWGGDRYAYLKDASDNKLLVINSVWDTTADADEFFNTYIDFMEEKLSGTTALRIEDTGKRWWQAEGLNVYLSQSESDVLIVIAPDEVIARQVLLAFPEFYTPPQANFSASPATGVSHITVQFTDQCSGNITDWKWDFNNDGKVDSTEQNPTYEYTESGIYTVSLTITDAYGASNKKTKTDYIIVKETEPKTDFEGSPNSGDEPLTVNFTDISTSYYTITSWLWDFGDGQTSTDQNPIHEYAQYGIYTVSLTTTENNGDSAYETKVDYIVAGSILAQQTVSPDNPSTVASEDDRIVIEFPEGAVDDNAEVIIWEVAQAGLPACPEGYTAGNTCFNVDLTKDLKSETMLTIFVEYSDNDLAACNGDPDNLTLARYDEAAGKWVIVDTEVDEEAQTLTTDADELGIWTVMADEASDEVGTDLWIYLVSIFGGLGVLLAIGGAIIIIKRGSA